MKLVTILGARPQFIKASMVSMEIANYEEINEVIIHTGQHFDENMSRIFFEEMGIPEPDYNLGVNSLSHGTMTGRQLEKIEKILIKEKPDRVLVYGDTDSTLAGALAAVKLHIPVAHIEAGLRSFNRKMPEEINRILTDHAADMLFAPTETAVNNLKHEGFDDEKVYIVGDVMYDAALHFGNIADEKSSIIDDIELEKQSYVLCTVHRQENTDNPDRLRSIVEALNQINRKIRVVLPLHPRTQQIVENEGYQLDFKQINPVGYLDILTLLKDCKLVLTDSGGLQKEAFFFEKHCITLRDETEWVELVDHGFNTLVRVDKDKILTAYQKMVDKSSEFNIDLYGNGKSRKIIVDLLVSSKKYHLNGELQDHSV